MYRYNRNHFDTLELKLNAVFVRSSKLLSIVMPQVFLAQSSDWNLTAFMEYCVPWDF